NGQGQATKKAPAHAGAFINNIKFTGYGEPWFCLKDVCDVLNIANSRRVASEVLDQYGVRKTYITDSMGRKQEAAFVNEPNL
ncbi:hypothetical protein MPC91_003473, partial [Salmonella enterica]|nr:hypothetical protein [Salmonella enterica]EBR7475250.1 hypothetical protein [Salmonella enterica]EIZ6823556.1 hypothetical protein [Salmonella enterica]EKH9091388.1 hypothetical protein [Salmonella enterica]EKO4187381.1 hypothetical protein [Salmonella enterica]